MKPTMISILVYAVLSSLHGADGVTPSPIPDLLAPKTGEKTRAWNMPAGPATDGRIGLTLLRSEKDTVVSAVNSSMGVNQNSGLISVNVIRDEGSYTVIVDPNGGQGDKQVVKIVFLPKGKSNHVVRSFDAGLVETSREAEKQDTHNSPPPPSK